MSYSPNPKEGYTKMVNIKQDGGQHVEVYIPDTRRRRSPEAEARALARSEIKEQYKAAALAEEVKAIKKQRNKLVDNLAKVGRSPSFIADIPSATGLSGTSSITTPSATTSKATSQLGNLNYQTGNLNYSAPIGPLPSSSMGGFKNRPYDNRINYSQPIGPLPSSSMGGFQNRPYNPQINYTSPIGPVPGPGMGGFQNRPYNPQLNYTSPIGPSPYSGMGGSQNLTYPSQINYPRSSMTDPFQGPIQSSSPMRNIIPQPEPEPRQRTPSPMRNIIPQPEPETRQRTPSPMRNIISQPEPEPRPLSVPHSGGNRQGSISQQDTSKWTPEMLLPGKTLSEVEAVYKQRKASAVKKGRKKLARALDRAIVIRRKQFGASSGKPFQASPGRSPASSPTGKTPTQTTPERNAEYLLPGKTEQAVRRVYAERRAAALRKGNKDLVARLDRALPVRLQRLKSQGANVLKVSPERLLPGKTLAEVEATYKQRRAAAGAKGRTSLVKALDRAIVERRKQFGASPGKTPQTTPVKSPTGKTPMPTTPERNAEYLLPGKTEQAVRKVYAERRAAALRKGNKDLVARLDRALPVRLQRLKSQGANVFKVSPERLLPGKTLAEVEATYKQRRAAAGAKGRTSLVQALDRAIAIRRTQLGGSSDKVPPPPGKVPSSSGKVPSSPGKVPFPSGKEWKDVFGPVDMTNPNPRAVSEKYQALRKRTKDEDVSKLNALFKKAIVDIKLIKRQRAAQQSKTSGIPSGKPSQSTPVKPTKMPPGKSPGNVFKIAPERLIPGKTLAEVEATYNKRRAAAVAKGRTALVQALDRAIGIRRKQFAGSPGKTPLPSGKEWKDVFGPVDMTNPNPRAVSEKYQALRKRTKDEDVSKLNALFKKAIMDIKLIKRQRAAQESKSAEATKAKVEAEKAKAKSAEVKKSIEREIISTKRKIRDVSVKAKKASANIERAGKEISAATVRRDTRKAEKLTRFSRKRQQNLRSAQEVRGKLITSLKGLEQKSAKVSSTPLMLTQGSPNPMARQFTQQQSVQQQKSAQTQAKAQQFLAEKARTQSAKIQQSGKQMAIKAAQDKIQSAKAQSAKLEQDKRQKSVSAEKAKAQSAKIEQEKRQKSAKIEQDKRLQLAKAQSAKAQSAKMDQIKKAQTSQKRQMSQARPPVKMMRPRRR